MRMDSEKVKQMDMQQFEDKKKFSTSAVLAISMAVIAVALALLAVLGTVYFIDLKMNGDGKTPQYQVRHDEKTRYVLEDKQDQIELIRNKDSDGHLVSMIALDYKARVISIYVPKDDKCFVIGGIVEEIGSFEDDIPIEVVTEHKPAANASTSAGPGVIRYVVKDHTPIDKTDLISPDLQPHCSNINTVWLERSESQQHHKQKRLAIPLIVGGVIFIGILLWADPAY